MSFLFPNKPAAQAGLVVVSENRDDDTGWRRLGEAARDLPFALHQRTQETSVTAYRRNPLANRTVKIYTSFLAGSGFDIRSNHPQVDQILTEAWTSPRSDLERNHRGFARDWLLFGESFLPVASDDAGNVTVGYIDPNTVESVGRDPRNNMLITGVKVRAPFGAQSETLDAVRMDTTLTSPNVGRLSGDVFVWLFERIGASTRGMPMLMPILDWFNLYDDSMWEINERRKAMRAHMRDVSVEGSPDDVAALEEKWGTAAPKTGSTRFHTANVKIEAVSPQLGQHEDVAGLRATLRQLAAGGGLAPHWLGDPEDANRATAESMDIPVLRSLVDVQDAWRTNMRDMCRFVIDQKVAANMLPAVDEVHDEEGDPTGERGPTREMFDVFAPEIESKRVAEAAATLLSVANAMVTLDAVDGVGRQAIRKVVRTLLPSLGVPAEELPDEDDSDEQAAGDVFDQFTQAHGFV